ncbi:MAG: hypothetical protein CR981_02655 [Proteobacteria bacterium]|nr:MAG: hypothetical protein CR981_02655 [Pseudomonadota bacterium]
MKKNYSLCLLTQGRNGTPEFSVSPRELRSGTKFPVNAENVLLASGFPCLDPDSGFPLSPTLQLNSDLGQYSTEFLECIATTELMRVNEATFRSYLIEPDNRLCVIGCSAEGLRQFVDTYGGILEIEPILLTTQAPDFPSAITAELTGETGNYTLHYSLRSPVIPERCTYCGACGPACPEGCLDEWLHIDFTLCSLCKTCEEVCPVDAIDIHGVEERTDNVPAVLLLEDVSLECPEDTGGIYRQETLHEFFATQFPFQVDEVVTCNTSLCQYSGKHRTGCTLCLDACTHNAIQKTGTGLLIDSVRCEECGSCIGVCPTGAMQYRRLGDASFIAYFRSLQIEPGTTVVLGSENVLHHLWWHKEQLRGPQTLFVELPRVATMSLFHLLFLYACGAGRVLLLDTNPEEQSGLKTQVALASSLIAAYWQQQDRIILTTPVQYLQIAADHHPSPVIKPVTLSPNDNRRKNLNRVLAFFTDATGRTTRIKKNRALPFARISCDNERCTQCYACLNECRIEALHTNQEQLALEYRPGLCVGCGVCLRVCPENALQMKQGALLDETFFSNTVLAEAEPMRCKECGKIFGTKKSYERVMAILSQKEEVDTLHFEHCEDCRVIRLFAGAE